jgi:hypothetical protein
VLISCSGSLSIACNRGLLSDAFLAVGQIQRKRVAAY